MNNAHVMLDNSVTIACSVPSHLSDHVFVVSWRIEEGSHSEPVELKESSNYGSVPPLHGRSSHVLGPHPVPIRPTLQGSKVLLSFGASGN